MPLYVQVCAGPSAAEAVPMLATGDRDVVWRTMYAIVERAAAADPRLIRVELIPPPPATTTPPAPTPEEAPCPAS